MSTSPPLLHDGGLVAEHHDGVQQEHVVSLLPGRSQHLQVARPPQPPEVLQPRALGEINGLDTSLNIFQDGKVLFILKIIYFSKSSYTHFIHYKKIEVMQTWSTCFSFSSCSLLASLTSELKFFILLWAISMS